MKIKGLSLSTDGKISPFQKVLVASLILAMLVAAFSFASVSAQDNDKHANLEQAWSDKVARLSSHTTFLNSLQLMPAAFMNNSTPQQALGPAIPVTGDEAQAQAAPLNRNRWSDWQLAQLYLDKYRAAMGQAQTIIVQNGGFDSTGEVVNQKLARQSLRDLATQLQIMSAMREKLTSLGTNSLFLNSK